MAGNPKNLVAADQDRQFGPLGQCDLAIDKQIFELLMAVHPQGFKPIAATKVPHNQPLRQRVGVETGLSQIRAESVDPATATFR